MSRPRLGGDGSTTRPATDDDRAWRQQAACRDEDPELFFPVVLGVAQEARAKAVCRRCPVQSPCLDWALRTGSDGIWAGTTEDERRAMRRPTTGGATA